MKIRFVMWDWKEQPDIEWFNHALQDTFNGKNAPCVTLVDAGGDTFVVVVSGEKIDERQAQEVYDTYRDLPDDENSDNEVLDIEWP